MSYVIAYITALVVFGAIDATWLTLMGPILYRPVLGEIIAPSLRIAPAIVFYLMYPIGLVVFAVTPALRSGAISTAFLLALLFGAIAYGTYDLTNYATLRVWTMQITIADLVYGALTSAVAATAATFMVRLFGR